MNDCEHLAAYVCIYVHLLGERHEPILVEPPASFVFLGTVSTVVIIVLVVGAEFHALVTGPLWHTNLITSRQSISSCTYIGSKGKLVVILQREQWGDLVNLHELNNERNSVIFWKIQLFTFLWYGRWENQYHSSTKFEAPGSHWTSQEIVLALNAQRTTTCFTLWFVQELKRRYNVLCALWALEVLVDGWFPVFMLS